MSACALARRSVLNRAALASTSPPAAMHARERTSESCIAALQPMPMLGDTECAASPISTARPDVSLLHVTNLGHLQGHSGEVTN